jgi:ribosome-associated toxin RatA of RatAB toxin-antitoxin module
LLPKIDVTDEAVIDAAPSVVFAVLMEELNGAKKWWLPHWEASPRGNVPFNQIGGVIDITVHRIGTPRFTAKSTEVTQDKSLKAEFIEGDFLGTGEWTLEPLGDKTQVKFRFNVKPNRLMYSMMYPVVRRIHSGVMKQGYLSLNRYLKQK